MDVRLPKRWVRRVLILAPFLIVVAYFRYRNESDSSPNPRPRDPITERDATAFLIPRRIEPGHVETIRDHVSRTVIGSDPDRLLRIDGASTASLCLDQGRDPPEIVWYVEIPSAVVGEWDDPESRVGDAFPVEHERIGPTVEPVDRDLLVHAANPSRPRSIVPDERGPVDPTAPAAVRRVEVELVRMRLESGLPERLADRFARVSRRVAAGEVDLGPVETWSLDMLEAEAMFTESVFLERRLSGYELVQYMEASEMRRVYDVYDDSWNPVARLSAVVLDLGLDDPSCILDYPLESDFEAIAHVVHPNRPRRVGERRAEEKEDRSGD
ncbi:hypothetical protein [Natrinema halophilum]|uniref:Uncharacterized protein n=1 Tax=Natrinema halophilum TaxID=1699371 RepID=A0A7D5KCX4_9EURY|nr:hypothetical protein [Natrinema halophilum]QLG48981.1 hypothetical protein HYG82_09025 [Natrinema halophilum]